MLDRRVNTTSWPGPPLGHKVDEVIYGTVDGHSRSFFKALPLVMNLNHSEVM